MGTYLVTWNWLIGSKWAIALGELMIEEEKCYYYSNAKRLRAPPAPLSCGLDGVAQFIEHLFAATMTGLFAVVGIALLILYVMYARFGAS
jgi:hypothetical protein